MFPKIGFFCLTLRIGPCLFYIEKFTTQFKTTEKKIGHRSRFRENGLPLRRGPVLKKKPLFSNAHALIMVKLCAVGMHNAILGNGLKLYTYGGIFWTYRTPPNPQEIQISSVGVV